jgi:peroxiredoxin
MWSRLQNGDLFPRFVVDVVGGRTITLPDDLAGSYAVILFYRGSWCPYCCAQLSAFSRAHERLAAAGIAVVAVSVDDEATSRALIDRLHLRFPIGFGVNADSVAAATGAYLAESSAYLQSTGFVLDQSGRLVTAVYSSGAIGRLVPDDVAGLVKYVAGQRATAAAMQAP